MKTRKVLDIQKQRYLTQKPNEYILLNKIRHE